MNTPKILETKQTVHEAFRCSLRTLIISAQLFNAAPFPIKILSKDTANWATRVKIGKSLQSIWSFLLVIALIASLVYKRSWHLDDLDTPFITYVLYNFEIIVGLVTSTLIYIYCQWGRSNYEDVLNIMMNIIIEFGRFAEENDLTWLRYQFSKCLLACVFYFVVLIIGDSTYYWNVIITACTTGSYYIPSVVQLLSILQYAYVVIFAYRKCKVINGLLLAIRYSLRSNFKSYCPLIRALREQQMLLHRLVFKINRDYGILNILVVFSVIITIIITCLEIYEHMYIETLTLSTFQHVMFSVVWLIMHVCKLLLVLLPNHLMVNERTQTESILLSLPLIENKEFTNETSVFARQLLHQKGPYTAKGVLVLDLTLLVHIFGALTTYLVILIQFDQSLRKSMYLSDENIYDY